MPDEAAEPKNEYLLSPQLEVPQDKLKEIYARTSGIVNVSGELIKPDIRRKEITLKDGKRITITENGPLTKANQPTETFHPDISVIIENYEASGFDRTVYDLYKTRGADEQDDFYAFEKFEYNMPERGKLLTPVELKKFFDEMKPNLRKQGKTKFLFKDLIQLHRILIELEENKITI